ncbi:MAG: sulfite exporter TauE/SafE family protein [Colwellia sp.]|nr:sulfite exporter TauE/SafE family protein [Colwellia sp.]MCW8864927.1 sulfite exporter TauE/SafE family protein [Colwellia sp.]MCW9080545.1 sulfite exporter TauE/SafE family protein [Colwellia sp.]
MLIIFISCIALGSLVGFLAGLLGIGGGLIMVPAFVYLLPLLDVVELGFSREVVMHMALATSLAAIVITSSSAAFAHHKNGNIPWKITKPLIFFVAFGALSGAFIADLLSAKALTNFFAIAVMMLASYMLFSIRFQHSRTMPSQLKLQIISFITGIIASLMGMAGGAILVPVLTYFGTPLRHCIGIATVCGVMVALFGSLGYIISGLDNHLLPPWSLGYVYLPALLGVVLTSSLFAPVGVKFAAKMPVQTLKKCFAVFLILVALKMMLA